MLPNTISEGNMLGNSHKVISALDEGAFGVVAKCQNTVTGHTVAIKINKNHPKSFQLAREEIGIMKCLRFLDPDVSNIIRWNGFFFFKDQICMSFELLDICLYEYLVQKPQNCSTSELIPLIFQLATALLYLGAVGIIHSDLKLENIMVVDRNQEPIRVKIIDFGFASHVKDVPDFTRGGTMTYQAPEVLVQAPFDEAIDVWALGLIAVEMSTGHVLYPGKNRYDVLRFIIQTQGQPPDYVLNQGRTTSNYFFRENSQESWILKSPQTIFREMAIRAKEKRPFSPACLDDIQHKMVIEEPDNGKRERLVFVDLVKQMLELDPERRIKPLGVLQHPLFSEDLGSLSCFEETGEVEKIGVCEECVLLDESTREAYSDGGRDSPEDLLRGTSRGIWRFFGRVTAAARNLIPLRERPKYQQISAETSEI